MSTKHAALTAASKVENLKIEKIMKASYSVDNLKEGITEFFQLKIDACTPTAYRDVDRNILFMCFEF